MPPVMDQIQRALDHSRASFIHPVLGQNPIVCFLDSASVIFTRRTYRRPPLVLGQLDLARQDIAPGTFIYSISSTAARDLRTKMVITHGEFSKMSKVTTLLSKTSEKH
jgi:hypothetical protein